MWWIDISWGPATQFIGTLKGGFSNSTSKGLKPSSFPSIDS
jgi:hypothetical protein